MSSLVPYVQRKWTTWAIGFSFGDGDFSIMFGPLLFSWPPKDEVELTKNNFLLSSCRGKFDNI